MLKELSGLDNFFLCLYISRLVLVVVGSWIENNYCLYQNYTMMQQI